MAPAENNIIEVLQKASPSSQEHEENPNKWWMWNPNSKKEDDEKEKEKEKEEEESWEVKAFAEDTRNNMTCTWPPRSYTCTFCRREFRSAQALGGHMNVHRRDRARLHHPNINAASRLCLLLPNFSSTPPISTHHHYPPNYFHSFPSPTLPNHYSTTKFHLPSPHQDLDLDLDLELRL